MLAWGVLALVLGSPSLTAASGSSAADQPSRPPACRRRSNTPRRWRAPTVDVSPAPETDTANPHTQISFLGAPAARDPRRLGRRRAQRRHPGRAARLLAGRRRELRARAAVRRRRARDRARADRCRRAGKQVAFRFRVDTPYPTADVPAFPNPPAAPADYQSFYTLPGVQAPILTVTVARPRPGGRRHPHDQRPGPGPVRAADLHARRAGSCGSSTLSGGRDGRGPQRADLRRPARPDVVEGARALARLRPGRRHRDELAATRRSRGSPAATACRPTCTTSRSRPHDVAYITAYNPIRCDLTLGQGGARRRDRRHRDPGDRHEDRPRALGMAQPRPRRRRGVRSRNADRDDAVGLLPPQLDRPEPRRRTC